MSDPVFRGGGLYSQPVRRFGQDCESPAMAQTRRGAFSFHEKPSRTRLCVFREAMNTQLAIFWTKNFSQRERLTFAFFNPFQSQSRISEETRSLASLKWNS